jgi:hypothetical protein
MNQKVDFRYKMLVTAIEKNLYQNQGLLNSELIPYQTIFCIGGTLPIAFKVG